jgi:hypothetical protein
VATLLVAHDVVLEQAVVGSAQMRSYGGEGRGMGRGALEAGRGRGSVGLDVQRLDGYASAGVVLWPQAGRISVVRRGGM